MNRTIITFIVLSLLGLITIQAGLLNIGLKMEKEKYTKEIDAVLYSIKSHLYTNTELSQRIAQLSTDLEEKGMLSQDSLPEETLRTIDTLLKEQLAKRGISVDFSFALTDAKNQLLLTSSQFDPAIFSFNQHTIRFGSMIEVFCNCNVLLHFNQSNLYSYLFSQLAYLLLPSLIFLLIIIGGFSFLIYNLNRQKRLLTIKNDFINNLTHELKTPVFSISLLIKVFKERIAQNDTKKLTTYLALLDKENQKLKGHIDKVLELASLENGKYSLQKETCDFHTIIQEVVGDFHLKIDAAQGQLVENYQAVKGQLLLDKTHFKNVIQNLLDNAIKYSKDRPNIRIHTQCNEHTFSIAVSDNGIGIAPEHHRHLFDKFYRVTNGNLHNIKGFGLGLSYVKYIVEAHGGSIRVKSKEQEGATFIMEFPK